MLKEVETRTGFKCEIETDNLADMELLDDIFAMEAAEDNSKILFYRRIMNKLLPEETKRKLYDHIRTESGRVPPEAFEQELLDFFEALNKKK